MEKKANHLIPYCNAELDDTALCTEYPIRCTVPIKPKTFQLKIKQFLMLLPDHLYRLHFINY